MDTALVVVTVGAVVTAFGWLSTHISNKAIALRKDQLEFVNKQLSEFYGPLYISCKSGHAAYHTLVIKIGRKTGIFEEDSPPSEEEVKEWYHWMRTVLGPLNEKRDELILKSCHLIREDNIPNCITQFASHVAANRALLAKWSQGDYLERYASVPFPSDLNK